MVIHIINMLDTGEMGRKNRL